MENEIPFKGDEKNVTERNSAGFLRQLGQNGPDLPGLGGEALPKPLDSRRQGT